MFRGDTTDGNIVLTGTTTRTIAASRFMSVGAGYFTDTQFNDATDIAEYMVFESYLDQAALEAVYARTKTRMVARGITLV